MSKTRSYFRICSTHAMPAMPLPTTTSFSRSGMELPFGAAAIQMRGSFNAHRRLLVVWFAGKRVERALRHLVRVRLDIVEGDEELSRRNRLRDPHLDARHPATAGDDVDAVLRLHPERSGVAR